MSEGESESYRDGSDFESAPGPEGAPSRSSEVGRVVEVRRKLQTFPESARAAIEAVKGWIARRGDADSGLPIGEAVKKNLAARHVAVPDEILEKGWYAEPRKAGGWVVGIKFISGAQPRTAEWVVDDVRREVRAADDNAQDLEWVEDQAQSSNP